MKKLSIALLIIVLVALILCSCGEHKVCEPSARWITDKESHWHSCKVCDKKLDFSAHTAGEPMEENIVEPTPEKNGSKDVVTYCTVCERELSRKTEILFSDDHMICVAGEPVELNVVPATCTSEGSKEVITYCLGCNKELSHITEIIPVADHDYENDTTCSDGNYHWKKCLNCGAEDKSNKEAHNEDISEEMTLILASCSAEGKKQNTVYCSVCLRQISQTVSNIEKLPHSPGAPVDKIITASTCTSEGSKAVITYCTMCNAETSRKTEAVPVSAHDFENGSVTSAAEYHQKQCANCSALSTKEEHYGGTATYTEKAKCSVCGTSYGELRAHEYINISDYCIVYSSSVDELANKYAADDLQRLIKESTGIELKIVKDKYYWGSYGKMLAIGLVQDSNDANNGNLSGSIAPSLKAEAKTLGKDGFIIAKDSRNNIYFCGGGASGDRNAIYEFLNLYFNFEQFAIGNYHIDKTSSSFKLDMYYLQNQVRVEPDIDYRSNGYNGISANSNGVYMDDVYRMNYASNYGSDLLMFVKEGDWSSKSHNSMVWLPYSTYGLSHPNWYSGNFLTSSSKRDLCYTAHGNSTEYQAMIAECVARVKQILAISENADKTILQLGKQDTVDICTCSSCTAIKNQYGSSSATVIKFMNDLMAAIEADSTIGRKDFNLMFFAYEDFELAPTKGGLKLHDRVNVMLAAAYSFNYQASINDSTNRAGRENLQRWGDILGEGSLFLWTYSSKFNTFMYPTDTFAFYDEDAYRFFADNNVAMLFNQSQGQQSGAVTAWGNLKMYLDAQLAWDNTQTQEDLIDRYMNVMFDVAAAPMRSFFDSVRAACQNATLMNDYAAQDDGQAYTILGNKIKLNDTKYWSQSTIDGWLIYLDEAYAAIKKYETSDPALYARLKRNIDTEWVAAAFMRIDLYGTTSTLTVDKFKEIAITELGMTHCREEYTNVVWKLDEYISKNW